jgi:hypothetical protein
VLQGLRALNRAVGFLMPATHRNGHEPSFRGFPRNRYTQVPDLLFDELMPQLSNDELRVLLYVIRRTEGFKRDTDNISLSQFVIGITRSNGQPLDHGTGLSRAAVARGIKGLVSRGILVVTRRQDGKGGHLATTYRIHFDDDPSSAPVDHPCLTDGLPQSAGETILVHRREPQETEQETGGQEASDSGSKRQDEASALDVLWEQAKVELMLQMSKANYETWFRSTRLVDFDGASYTIWSPSEFTADWLRTRCMPLITKTLQGITGAAPKACSVVSGDQAH